MTPDGQRGQKAVTVQDFYQGQMRVSGYKIQQDLYEEQCFAKTLTSLLTLPQVFGVVFIYHNSRN
jgi:hypothetical protein